MGITINPLQPAKVFLNYSPRRKISILVAAVILLAIILTAGYGYAHRDVTINDNGKIQTVTVIGGNVEKALQKKGIKLAKEDLVEPNLKTPLKKGMQINITRAFPVKLIADGKTSEFKTPYNKVDKILSAKHIKLGELDKVEPGKDAKVEKGAVIKVIRVVVKTEVKQQEIAFSIEKRNDNNLEKGKTQVVQQGQKGLEEITQRVVYEDGKEVQRENTGKKVIIQPVKSIVAVGTISYMIASRGETLKYSKVQRMYATWYTAPAGAHTASGMPVSKGVVSVPPWIPFGTKLYIPGYGYAIAADRGSGIQGNSIDLFFDHYEGWNSKYVDVYFLE